MSTYSRNRNRGLLKTGSSDWVRFSTAGQRGDRVRFFPGRPTAWVRFVGNPRRKWVRFARRMVRELGSFRHTVTEGRPAPEAGGSDADLHEVLRLARRLGSFSPLTRRACGRPWSLPGLGRRLPAAAVAGPSARRGAGPAPPSAPRRPARWRVAGDVPELVRVVLQVEQLPVVDVGLVEVDELVAVGHDAVVRADVVRDRGTRSSGSRRSSASRRASGPSGAGRGCGPASRPGPAGRRRRGTSRRSRGSRRVSGSTLPGFATPGQRTSSGVRSDSSKIQRLSNQPCSPR